MSKKTDYAQLSDKALYCMLRTSKWKGYDKDTRLELLQEVENRKAAEMGREALTIIPFKASLGQKGLMGYFSPDKPTELYVNEKFLSGKEGILHDYSVGAALDCIFHEGRHAYQYAVAEGRIKDTDEYQRKMWRLNLSNYYDGRGGIEMQTIYTRQEIEFDARLYARSAVKEIAETIHEETGYWDAGLEKTIDRMYAYERIVRELAERLLTVKKMDAIDDAARAKLKELYPDENVDDISMFGKFYEFVRKQEKKDKLDEAEKFMELVGADGSIDDLFKRLEERLKETVDKQKETVEDVSFREGGVGKNI